jgi:hypothetical protein
MDSNKQRVHTPLKNHLVHVRKVTTPVPVVGHTSHYQELHDKYLHEVDGEECYEHPLDVLVSHLHANKDHFGALTVLLDLAIANNGMHTNLAALRDGSTNPAELFAIAWVQNKKDQNDKGRPAESFVTTAENKVILPVDLHDAAMLYGIHHYHGALGPHTQIPSRGGQMSLGAIAALDDYLKEVGVQPNHPIIRRQFCANCQK